MCYWSWNAPIPEYDGADRQDSVALNNDTFALTTDVRKLTQINKSLQKANGSVSQEIQQ